MEATLPTISAPPNALSRVHKLGLTAWWTAFCGVLLLGFFLAIVGYNHGLPFIDYGDEMTIWSFGRATIDPSLVNTAPNYPPVIVLVSVAVQKVQIALGDPFINVAATVQVMRLMSVAWFVVALAVIMLLAHRLAGPFAGIFAGLFWATLPLAVVLAKLSTNNLWLSAWFIITVAAGIEGWRRRSLRWIAFSFVAGLVATLIKYQAGAVLLIAPLACLSLWNVDRKKMLGALAVMFVILAVFAYWAVFIFHALSGEIYIVGQKNALPTVANAWINLLTQVSVAGPFLIFGFLPVIALVLSVLLPSARRLNNQFGLWMSLPVILAFEMILSTGGAPVFERQYLSAMTLLAVLAGVGVGLVVDVIQRIIPGPRWSVVKIPLIACIFILVGYPVYQMANESRLIALTSTYPDRRTILADWARSTATEGPLLITDPNLAIAVQTLFGYRGRPIDTPYNINLTVLVKPDEIDDKIVQAQHIRYIVAPPNFKPEKLSLPLTPLITYDYGPNVNGPAWTAYYVGPLPVITQTPMATFGGEVVLRGFSLSKTTACASDQLESQMLWSAAQPPSRYYSTYVHLYNPQIGEINLPLDGPPISQERPTVSWTNPTELLVGPRRLWAVPAQLAPGQYEVRLGVYEPVADNRLTLPDGKDHLVLGKLNVENCARRFVF